jgi:hypothetical protein
MMQAITLKLIFTATISLLLTTAHGGQYLVVGSGGPGFKSPHEAIQVLEKGILPTFEALLKLQKQNRIIAGGLPVGDRSLSFILQASSNDEVDNILRDLPAWGVLNWQVTALQSFSNRAEKEQQVLRELKKMLR